jgi:hypothetical protein
MSDKVKLPKEIATYIEDLLIGGNNEMLISGVLGNANSQKYIAVRNYFKKDFDSLLQALVNGYEVELTPEDRVRRMFDEACREERYGRDKAYASWWGGRRMTIIDTLNALGINIIGVNEE